MTFEDIAAALSDRDGDKVDPHINPASTLVDAHSAPEPIKIEFTEPVHTTMASSHGIKRAISESRDDDEHDEHDDDDESAMDASFMSSELHHSSHSPQPRVRKPLRKRAKTQEEKEQRAHERIMRNRLAAQTSRERKREYVQQLEQDNKTLESRVNALSSENKKLKSTVSDLTKRLEQMERVLSFFSAPVKTETDDTALSTPVTPVSNLGLSGAATATAATTSSLNAAPILSHSPHLSTHSSMDEEDNIVVGLRSPAATALKDPQRRPTTTPPRPQQPTTTFPWNLSTRSPAYQVMESLLRFWTTWLMAQSTLASMRPISTYRRRHPSCLTSTSTASTRSATASATVSTAATATASAMADVQVDLASRLDPHRLSRSELTSGALFAATERARPRTEGRPYVSATINATSAAPAAPVVAAPTFVAAAVNDARRARRAVDTTSASLLLSKWTS